eukprot:6178976-Pleurochrysis_carterae.AAC.6
MTWASIKESRAACEPRMLRGWCAGFARSALRTGTKTRGQYCWLRCGPASARLWSAPPASMSRSNSSSEICSIPSERKYHLPGAFSGSGRPPTPCISVHWIASTVRPICWGRMLKGAFGGGFGGDAILPVDEEASTPELLKVLSNIWSIATASSALRNSARASAPTGSLAFISSSAIRIAGFAALLIADMAFSVSNWLALKLVKGSAGAAAPRSLWATYLIGCVGLSMSSCSYADFRAFSTCSFGVRPSRSGAAFQPTDPIPTTIARVIYSWLPV